MLGAMACRRASKRTILVEPVQIRAVTANMSFA
jgi:hypothetical protein